jgi:D-alanyl-D-alanine carboxypeptidase
MRLLYIRLTLGLVLAQPLFAQLPDEVVAGTRIRATTSRSGAQRTTGAASIAPRSDSLRRVLQATLDSFRIAARIPGMTLGVALADGRTLAFASGESDTARHVPMRTTDRLLQGSVGKTYVAALAMQLVAEGKLDLDAKIEKYLGKEPWFDRLPNAHDITVRQLMQHTSGLVRYEFQPEATAVLRAQPFKEWTPEERLSYILGKTPPFKAGEGWEYSDTNYIVVGMIIERLLGTSYYDAVKARILQPLALKNTIPSDRRDLPGVANGYAGPRNDLGGYDASIKDGLMQINPQFEWTGGGMASTADDLARWAKLMYEGKAFEPRMLPVMTTGVPAKLGQNTKYGLGVIIRETPEGPLWGHSGFFPGYATEMLYDPRTKVAVAVQANITQPYPRGLVPLLIRAAATAKALQ